MRPEVILAFVEVAALFGPCLFIPVHDHLIQLQRPVHDHLIQLRRVGWFGLTRCLEARMLLTPQVRPVRSQFTRRVVHKGPRCWWVLNQCFSCGHKRLSEPWFTLSALCSLDQSGPRCRPHGFGLPFFPGVWEFLTILIGVLCFKDMFFSVSGFIFYWKG